MLAVTSLRILGLKKGPANCMHLNGLIGVPAMISVRQLSMPLGSRLPQGHLGFLSYTLPPALAPPSRLVLTECQSSHLSSRVVLPKMSHRSSNLDFMLPLRHRSSPCQATLVDSAAEEEVLEAGSAMHAGGGGTAVSKGQQRASGRASASELLTHVSLASHHIMVLCQLGFADFVDTKNLLWLSCGHSLMKSSLCCKVFGHHAIKLTWGNFLTQPVVETHLRSSSLGLAAAPAKRPGRKVKEKLAPPPARDSGVSFQRPETL